MFKKTISILFSFIFIFSAFTTAANAADTKSAVNLSVRVDKNECSTLGKILVTVNLKNNTKNAIKNIVVSSSESEGICMYKPSNFNVVVKNPGSADLVKTNAMTDFIKPGGEIQYSYYAMLSYKASKSLIPESTRKIMLRQHQLLKTIDFRPVSVASGSSVRGKTVLKFGDVETKLIVNGYYNIKDSTYDKIKSGESVFEANNKEFRSLVDEYEKFIKNTYIPAMKSSDFERRSNARLKDWEYSAKISLYSTDHGIIYNITESDQKYWEAAEERIEKMKSSVE